MSAKIKQKEIEIPKIFHPIYTSNHRYKCIYGGRASGKSHAVARYILARGMSESIRILCTREIQKSLSESALKLLADLINEYNLPYHVLKTTIRGMFNKTEFIFHGLRDDTAKSIKSMEGIDIAWVEEAQFVSTESLDILIPTIRKPGSQIIFTYNRLEEFDPVHVKFAENPSPDTMVIYANYFDNIFCPEEIMKEALRRKDENYNDYLHIWEGQPLIDGDNIALPIDKVKLAMDRTIENQEGPIQVGIDVARGGGDRTAIFIRHGLKIINWWFTDKALTTDEIIGRLSYMLGDKVNQLDLIKSDDTGLGWALSEALQKKFGHAKVQPINFAEKAPIDKTKYPNITSYLYFAFEELMLDHADIPNSNDLLKELSTRRYHYKNANQLRQIEKKDDYKKRYQKSPDLADALLLCYVSLPTKPFGYKFL